MVKYDTILIRFGELSTKGKNRKEFIKQLEKNLKFILKDFSNLKFRRTHDRIYIQLTDEDTSVIREKIQKVFGISSFSFTKKIVNDMEEMKKVCVEIAQNTKLKTFKMITRRHDKTYPMHSDEINRAIAGRILHETDLTVDVHHPELEIRVEVHKEYSYITSEKIVGAGGYPAGMNGKVLLLLSGGIDSPVAAYELMKRGLKVEAIHFASPPYTSENAKQKVLDLAQQVSFYQGGMKVHMINFTDLQLEIYKAANDSYAITLMRRMMFRIAEQVAEKYNCLALGTGESVGQVASQTLESIACINEVVNLPILRPLVCMDKIEIIELARRIGTYETSILPFEDCCTIFDPKNPVTKPTVKKARYYEEKFKYVEEIQKCMDTETINVVYPTDKQDSFL